MIRLTSNRSASAVRSAEKRGTFLTIALAGNANVGKSAIFNQLTGLVQETGNWSGKTVGIREGVLSHHGIQVKIVDLPGIYSFSTYSGEELVTREFILMRRPDVVINVLDATSLERNLYFTLQLTEMAVPVVLALNYADIAKKKHINIDTTSLGNKFGAPVINTVATRGIGVHELVDAALGTIDQKVQLAGPRQNNYGPEVEDRVTRLSQLLAENAALYPSRWTAIKLLEGDPGVLAEVAKYDPGSVSLASQLSVEIARIHGEEANAVIASERYALAAKIAAEVTTGAGSATRPASRLENVSLHPVAGYILFVLMMVAILVFISFFGGWLTDLIARIFNSFNPHATGLLAEIFWNGAAVGFYAALSVALGFILPFFFILGWLGESGYLPRIAFIMDRPCHLLGLHGQASLPMITALGCNVPACMACRVLENRRDRLIATFLSTMVPCSARTSVVLGLVGAFIGWQWAIGLLFFQFILIFIIGRILSQMSPSTSPGIIMEIPEYRLPSLKIVWRQAWNRFKDFLILGVPLIIAGSMAIESLRVFGLLDHITNALTPVTVTWLGLPAFTGVLLIFGILRKEANLALLIALAGGAAINSLISPLQMVVFSIVILLYVPCLSTIAVLVKETGLKITLAMIFAEIALAIAFGGIAARVLPLIFGS